MITRRLSWMVLGGAVSLVVKARAEQAIAVEAGRLPQRIPAARLLLDRLPPDVARAAGAAVVAGRTAAVAGRVVARGGTVAHGAVRRARIELDATRSAWQAAAAEEERLLRADLARLDGDEIAAVDALLDRRPLPPVGRPPAVPAAVPPGRPRATADPVAGAGGRVQRSYRGPSRPWSSPAR